MSAAGVLRFHGTAVTFSRTVQTHTASTGVMTPATTTVAGYAMRVTGEPKEYEALGLVQSEALTLEFTPTTAGEVPALGSSVTFGGAAYTVKAVWPTAPAGTATRARVVVAR